VFGGRGVGRLGRGGGGWGPEVRGVSRPFAEILVHSHILVTGTLIMKVVVIMIVMCVCV
jgi:hypothetical protein